MPASRVKADLPDVKKEDVKVEFEEGVLTVEGEHKQEKEESEVDAHKLAAEFKEGVLNVHLPKSSNGKPKALTVKVA